MIPFLAGIYFTLYGYGIIGKGATGDPDQDEKRAKLRRVGKIAGPGLMGIGLIYCLIGLLQRVR
jgi:hypothetical protein